MTDYKCVRSLDELKDYIDDNKVFSFDIETSADDEYRGEELAALDPHKSSITGVSFSVSEGTGIYVPLRHRRGNKATNMQDVESYIANLLTDRNRVKIAHNLAFETMFYYHQGTVIQEPCYDTIAASQLTLKTETEFRELKDSGLKKLVPEFFGIEMPSFADVTVGRHFDELDPDDEETIRYACADSDYTLRLYHLFNEWFDKYMPTHRYIVEKLESPTAVFVGLMKHNGILVDIDLMLEKKAEAEEKLSQLREDISDMIGEVNLGLNAATKEFKDFLYTELELPVLKTTEKFNEAADDEALMLLADWSKDNRPELVPLFDKVLEFRKWGKLKSTYIDGYLTQVNYATGRIHPNFFQLGTETGRFASRKPNLQNIPRKGNDRVGVRNFFKAAEHYKYLDLDFSQIELRVGAYYCQDAKMLETYRNGGDIHAQTTSVIYNIPFEEALDTGYKDYKERRSIAKNSNFGVFYGLYPKGLQRNLQFKAGLIKTEEECAKIINNLKSGYPGLTRWQNDTKRMAKHKRYSETVLGRRRYLKGILSPEWGVRSYWERCALNTPIQGTAADILKLAMARLVAGLGVRPYIRPLLTIHDELVFEVPEDKVQAACAFIKDCMEAVPFEGFDVPIIAEGAIGDRFGSLEELG
jgi:DNA polymerase-1